MTQTKEEIIRIKNQNYERIYMNMDKNTVYLKIYIKNKGIKSICAEMKRKYVNNFNHRIN